MAGLSGSRASRSGPNPLRFGGRFRLGIPFGLRSGTRVRSRGRPQDASRPRRCVAGLSIAVRRKTVIRRRLTHLRRCDRRREREDFSVVKRAPEGGGAVEQSVASEKELALRRRTVAPGKGEKPRIG